MLRCQRIYNGVRCKGYLADDGAGGFENCSLCSKPKVMTPSEANAYYIQNAQAIIADIREIGRTATRIKWQISKDGLCRQEKRWVSQGLITQKDRGKWTKASGILCFKKSQKSNKEPAFSSSDRGRKITPTEEQYKDSELRLPLGDVHMGNLKLEMNLKVGKKTLMNMVRKAIDEISE